MKILMAAPFDVKGRYQGGISTIVNTVMSRPDLLCDRGMEIIKYETCRVERTQKGDAALSLVNLKSSWNIHCSLTKEAKKHKPDCLYFHSSVRLPLLKDLLALRHAKKKTRVKTVLHIHFAEYDKIMTGKRFFDRWIFNILKQWVDKVVFLSRATAEEFIAHGLERSKTAVIYNFSTVSVTDEEQKVAVGQVGEPIRFLFIGSIDRRKGICDLLSCLERLEKPFELHLCGGYNDPSVETEVKQCLQRMGDLVVYHGYVSGEEKKKIYLMSDVLVLPSYGEGLPMVIMEAYHAGCAVISTAVGAIPEIMSEGNGFLLLPGDQEALSASMLALIRDPVLLKNMKKTNVETSKAFTIEQFVADVAKICEEIA